MTSLKVFNLTAKSFLAFAFIHFMVHSEAQVLRHSYTFENQTANDKVGVAHGKLVGGSFDNGDYVVTKKGDHIELPAAIIQINNYKGITLESHVFVNNYKNYSTVAYFGGYDNGDGVNYLIQEASPNSCRSEINSEKIKAIAPSGKIGNVNDLYHHLVTTIDDSLISIYVDGKLVSSEPLPDIPENRISNLSNDFAFLFKSVSKDASDNAVQSRLGEFNIYEGAMNSSEVQNRANEYSPGILMLNTYITPSPYDPWTEMYKINTLSISNDSMKAEVGFGVQYVNIQISYQESRVIYKYAGTNDFDVSEPYHFSIARRDSSEIKEYTISWDIRTEPSSINTISHLSVDGGYLKGEFKPEVNEYVVLKPISWLFNIIEWKDPLSGVTYTKSSSNNMITVLATSQTGKENLYKFNIKKGDYIFGWDGDGIVGEGSTPNNFGWDCYYRSDTLNPSIDNWDFANAISKGKSGYNDNITDYTYEDSDKSVESRQIRLSWQNPEILDFKYSKVIHIHQRGRYLFTFDYVAGGGTPSSHEFSVTINNSKKFSTLADSTVYRTGSFEFEISENEENVYRISFENHKKEQFWLGLNNLKLERVFDFDEDGIYSDDNCPNTYNPGQEDADGNGIGDVCELVTGLNDPINDTFKIYPNPTSKQLHVSLKNDIGEFSYQVFTLSGDEIAVKVFKEGHISTLDVSTLKSGIYFLKISGPQINEIKRFIVSK